MGFIRNIRMRRQYIKQSNDFSGDNGTGLWGSDFSSARFDSFAKVTPFGILFQKAPEYIRLLESIKFASLNFRYQRYAVACRYHRLGPGAEPNRSPKPIHLNSGIAWAPTSSVKNRGRFSDTFELIGFGIAALTAKNYFPSSLVSLP